MRSETQQAPTNDDSAGEHASQAVTEQDRVHDVGRSGDDFRRILSAAGALLSQGEEMLIRVSQDAYTRRHPVAFNASIGGHYRHCLDHFTRLLRSRGHRDVNYDHRERDARIENEPGEALTLTRHLLFQLAHTPSDCLASPMRSRCSISDIHEPPPVTQSTFGREMVYVIAHAIHHFALISIMARLQQVELPEHFGMAPSTLKHHAGMPVS